MRAALKTGPKPGLTVTSVEVPKVGPTEVLINVRATSICGTDLHMYRWDDWAQHRVTTFPLIQGHELCGEVCEVGDNVTRIRVGDFVSAESHIVCGACEQCRAGNGHICAKTKIIGVDCDGSFAESIVLPEANCWKNPPDLPVEIAVLMENFGNAVHTAMATDIKGKTIFLAGCGPVGCMAVAACKAFGAAAVFVSDVQPYRLALAKKMGADDAIDARTTSVVETIRRATNGRGVDRFLEMSGAPAAIAEGYELLRDGGEAVAFGLLSRPMSFDFNTSVIFKGATVHGVIGRRLWSTWETAARLINDGAVDLTPVVTHRFDLTGLKEGFSAMSSGESGKVVFYPQGVPSSSASVV